MSDKLSVYYLDTDAKPVLSVDEEKEKKVIALDAGEYMVYEMLQRICNLLGKR